MRTLTAMMRLHRSRWPALVAVSLTLAGCTSTIDGQGSPAEFAIPYDGDGTVERAPAAQDDPVCQLYSDQEILNRFRQSVTVDDYGTEACSFEVDSGGFVTISHEPDLSARDATEGSVSDVDEVTFAGHPALVSTFDMVVSTGQSLDDPGCLSGAELLFGDDPDGTILPGLLERAVDSFAER